MPAERFHPTLHLELLTQPRPADLAPAGHRPPLHAMTVDRDKPENHIRQNREKRVALTRVPEIVAPNLETGNLAPSYETVRQWAIRGRKGIVLETITFGGRRFTSRAAIGRFVDALTAKGGHWRTPERERRSRPRGRRRRGCSRPAKTAEGKLILALLEYLSARYGVRVPELDVDREAASS